MLTFTALSGSAKSTTTSPLCYLLQVDDVRILLDCGSPDWCPEASSSAVKTEDLAANAATWDQYCDKLQELAPTIDLVLLSHGDLQHSGLYAYAYSRWGLKCPTYTSIPVHAMARIAVTEDVEGIRDEQEVLEETSEGQVTSEGPQSVESPEGEAETMEVDPTPSLKQKRRRYIANVHEIHDAFDSINVLRYQQPCLLAGKSQGLTITAFQAGHTLGGTIWKIRSPSAGTIMYAVNLNHMREHHLDGTVLVRPGASGIFEPLARPDLLITDAERASVKNSKRTDRNDVIIDTITSALSSRHSVLMPCDSSTRILELLVFFDQYWSKQRLRWPICLMSRTGREMLTFVRSMMEWLGGTINKEDVGVEERRRNVKRARDDDDDGDDAIGALALRFKHLEFFPNPQTLLQTYPSKDPKLILAVPASLSHGASRALFADFAAIPDNVVLLTSRGESGTLARELFDRWDSAQRGDDRWDNGRIGRNIMLDGALRMEMRAKIPLHGTELEEYLEKERLAREEKETIEQEAAQAQRQDQRILEADEDDSDTDSDEEEDEEDVEQSLGGDMLDLSNDIRGPKESRAARSKAERAQDGDWEMDGDEGVSKTMLSFDIYLKGNVSKATSFFKSADGHRERFRMFPYVEKKRRVDEFGETIDVGMWMRKGKILEEAQRDDKVADVMAVELPQVQEEPPSKFITTDVVVQLACRLLFVDLEGLNDGRAVKTIVPQINPRKMIVVQATLAATDELISSCGNIRAMTKDIFAPIQGEEIRIGQQTNSYSITLSDQFLSAIKMSSFEDNEVGFIRGRISLRPDTTPALEPLTSGYVPSVAKGVTLTGRPRVLGSRLPTALPHSTLIGDLKLTALKTRLATVGIHAELVGEGVLICGKRSASLDSLEESVAVRKTGRGKVEMEGAVSDVYYIVRREVYNLHASIAQS